MPVSFRCSALTCPVFDFVEDTAHPDLVRIKVGRTSDVSRRLREHRRRCPSFKAQLLGQYPPATPSPGTYTRGVPFAGALERLVHLELTDLAAQSNPSGRMATRVHCPDCQSPRRYIYPSLTVPQAARSMSKYLRSSGHLMCRTTGNGGTSCVPCLKGGVASSQTMLVSRSCRW